MWRGKRVSNMLGRGTFTSFDRRHRLEFSTFSRSHYELNSNLMCACCRLSHFWECFSCSFLPVNFHFDEVCEITKLNHALKSKSPTNTQSLFSFLIVIFLNSTHTSMNFLSIPRCSDVFPPRRWGVGVPPSFVLKVDYNFTIK